jgi:hypothetical protein
LQLETRVPVFALGSLMQKRNNVLGLAVAGGPIVA